MQIPIAIVDCNGFYAACERSMNMAELHDKPIVVLSNNDGVIIALNREAKALGIKNFTPKFQIEHLIKKHNVRFFSANFALYNEISHKVMNVIRRYSPLVEVYSIDEAFIRLDGFKRFDTSLYCREILETIEKETNIPVTIGIANTKTLAKAANRIAKKDLSYKGVLNFLEYDDLTPFLEKTPIEDVWGIGRRHSKRLVRYGITHAMDFTRLNEKWVKRTMSVVGLRTLKELKGFPCIAMNYKRQSKKMIGFSRSFGKEIERYEDMKEAVAFFVSQAAERMRMQNSEANSIGVFIKTSFFKEDKYVNSYSINLPVATAFTSELIHYATEALLKIFKFGKRYNKAGVVLYDFTEANNTQLGLFDTENREKLTLATQAMDKINHKMGTNTIFLASLGTDRAWKQRSQYLSNGEKERKDSIIKTEGTISFLS